MKKLTKYLIAAAAVIGVSIAGAASAITSDPSTVNIDVDFVASISLAAPSGAISCDDVTTTGAGPWACTGANSATIAVTTNDTYTVDQPTADVVLTGPSVGVTLAVTAVASGDTITVTAGNFGGTTSSSTAAGAYAGSVDITATTAN